MSKPPVDPVGPERPTRHATGKIRYVKRPSIDREELLGWVDKLSGAMSIRSTQSQPDQGLTLLHELIHLEEPKWSEKRVLETERVLWSLIQKNPGPLIWIIWAAHHG